MCLHLLNWLVVVLWVDAICCSERLGNVKLARVGVHCKNAGSLSKAQREREREQHARTRTHTHTQVRCSLAVCTMLNSTHAIHSTQPTTIRAPPPPPPPAPPPLQLSYAGLLRGLDDGQSHGPETPHTDGAAWLNLRHKSNKKSDEKSDKKSDKSDKKKGDCVRLCACACVSRHHAYFPLPLVSVLLPAPPPFTTFSTVTPQAGAPCRY